MPPDQLHLAITQLYNTYMRRAQQSKARLGKQRHYHRQQQARGRLQAYERITRELEIIVHS